MCTKEINKEAEAKSFPRITNLMEEAKEEVLYNHSEGGELFSSLRQRYADLIYRDGKVVQVCPETTENGMAREAIHGEIEETTLREEISGTRFENLEDVAVIRIFRIWKHSLYSEEEEETMEKEYLF